MKRVTDIYDACPPERGAELRRLNKERLAQLEAESRARQARFARAATALAAPSRRPGSS